MVGIGHRWREKSYGDRERESLPPFLPALSRNSGGARLRGEKIPPAKGFMLSRCRTKPDMTDVEICVRLHRRSAATGPSAVRLEARTPASARHGFLIFAGKQQPLLLRIGKLGSGFPAFLHFLRGLRRRLFVKGRVRQLLVERLNQFLKLCRQGFDFVDLFLQRGKLGALFGTGLALICLRCLIGSSLCLVFLLPAGGNHEIAIFLHVAFESLDRTIGHQPQPVHRRLDQVAVVRDEDDGAAIVIQCLDQRAAAVDVEVVGRLVKDQQVRRMEGRKPHQQASFFATGQVLCRRRHFFRRKAHLGDTGAHLRFRCQRHQLAHMLHRRFIWHEIVQLMLREETDLQAGRNAKVARLRGEPAGNEFCEGGFTIAVGAKQRDAVVIINPEIELLQNGLAGLVTDSAAIDGDDGRGGLLFRLRKGDRLNMIFDHGGHRAHALQCLDAALRLPGLGGLGAKSVDEALQVFTRGVVFRLRFHLQFVGLSLLPLELVVAAAIEGQLLLVQMHDRIDRVVEEIAVMADDDDGVRIAPDVIFQPERAFEVEIVGRFVKQQKVGFGKQHRGERHAHPPAAGKGGSRAKLRLMVETEAGKDTGGARFC
ncbi:hypothetical protein AT6N2_C1226 [Agrobacterium tumefaciens]|nr:hypothetical protein AT6N2_C1226 [Agrobacterium tumefaciens]